MGKQIFVQPRNLEDFENDSRWFYENIDVLRSKSFTGKFVAVKNKEVIASNGNLNAVVSSIEEKGENPSYILVEFVYPEGTIVLL